jgi:hypothetical protein
LRRRQRRPPPSQSRSWSTGDSRERRFAIGFLQEDVLSRAKAGYAKRQ